MDREPRWKVTRDMFYSDHDAGEGATEGGTTGSISLESVKGGRIITTVIGAITSQQPYVQIVPFDRTPADNRTDAAQTILDSSNTPQSLRQVAENCFWSNMGTLYLDIDTDPVYRLKQTVVDPFELIAYPPSKGDINECFLILRQIKKTRDEVEADIADGTYEPGPIVSSDPVDYQVDNQASQPVETWGDDEIQILTGVVKMPGTAQWHDITVSGDGTRIYMFGKEPRPYKLSPFVVFAFKPSRGTDGIYPSVSIANDLQQAQLFYDMVVKGVVDGIAWKGRPAILTNDSGVADAIRGKLFPGAVIPVDDPASTKEVGGDVDIPGVVQMLNLLEQYADQASSVSQMAQGSAQGGVNTATEANLITQGGQAGLDSFILTFSGGMEQAVATLDERMRLDETKGWWKMYYGSDDPQAYKEEAVKAATFQATVTGSKSTPQARKQTLESVVQLWVLSQGQMPFSWQEWTAQYSEALEHTGLKNAAAIFTNPLEQSVNTLAQAMQIDPQQLAQILNQIDNTNKQQQQLEQQSGMAPNGAGGGVQGQPQSAAPVNSGQAGPGSGAPQAVPIARQA